MPCGRQGWAPSLPVTDGDLARQMVGFVRALRREGLTLTPDHSIDAITVLDHVALGWFLLCWLGYTGIADYSRWRTRSVTAAMSGYRRQWMAVMLLRENRVVDTTIIGNLLNGVAFFASTTIFAIGGLLAAIGATDSAIDVLKDLPFAVETTRTMWEMKVLLLVAILVFAFFKACLQVMAVHDAFNQVFRHAPFHQDPAADLRMVGAQFFPLAGRECRVILLAGDELLIKLWIQLVHHQHADILQ